MTDVRKIDDMEERQFENFLERATDSFNTLSGEDVMAATLTEAMKAHSDEDKIKLYVTLASLAMHEADKMLGSRGTIGASLAVTLN